MKSEVTWPAATDKFFKQKVSGASPVRGTKQCCREPRNSGPEGGHHSASKAPSVVAV